MSIFPKTICPGEYVIFHMGFKCILPENKKISYCLKVYNPNNVMILKVQKDLNIVGNNKMFEKNVYYPIFVDDTFLAGKYIIDFYLISDGEIIKSSTYNNDYFNVEKISSFFYKMSTNKYKIELKNESKEMTTITLYLHGKTKNIEKEILLKPFEIKKIVTSCSKVFFKYGNNNFDIIPSNNNIFFKDNSFKLKETLECDCLTNMYKKIKVSETELLVWNNINDFSTYSEIKNKLNINESKLKKIINKFIEERIIFYEKN